jgi:hypothetical protein
MGKKKNKKGDKSDSTDNLKVEEEIKLEED